MGTINTAMLFYSKTRLWFLLSNLKGNFFLNLNYYLWRETPFFKQRQLATIKIFASKTSVI